MTRRTGIGLLAASIAAGTNLDAKEGEGMRELLAASQQQNKGVTVYMRGQSIGGVVTKADGDYIEMRSREHSRIVVRFESIDCVAMA